MKAWYLVCFDISDDRVRTRLGKLLLRHGYRVQESVFEIAVATPAQLRELRRQVLHLIEDENEVRFYRLCRDCRQASSRVDGQPVAGFPSTVIV
ncbi:MAG: CRISPR-associated endonuclease Cas2 [Gammaproteobacteria bacterium]|nr:MAG: CRISPR-associated endonuclease Cas2 [Gammaproteobacteria bacterium]